jgi:hypothetical protein
MDLFVDLKVPAVGGSQWTTAERQREEKSLCGNDLQTLLDFCGSPQNDAVERVMGIEPSASAWEAEVLPLYDARFIQQQVIRLAIVGDLRWRDKAVLFFLNAVGRFQIDYFKPEHEPLARAWLLA